MNDTLMEQLLRDGESSCLDYKQEQYPFAGQSDPVKSELLKDILAIANRWGHPVGYILIGVEEVQGARSIVHGVTDHIPDNDLQQFVNGKTNRPITFSYTVYPFEGKLIGIIEVPEQERPFYLRKNFGKLTKDTVYYRQGTSTAIADLDEVKRMGAAESAKKHEAQRQQDETEQVRVQLGLQPPRGMYADIVNIGKVPVYVKRVELSLRQIDATKQPPFDESKLSVPFLASIALPVADGKGSVTHVTMGPPNADIEPKREVRFVLPVYPSDFLANFTKNADALSLTIETYTGVIHTEPGARVMPVVTEYVKLAKLQEELAKPINVKFYKTVGAVFSECGSAIVQRTSEGIRAAQKPTVKGFELTEEQMRELGRAVTSDQGQVCCTIGDYEWRLDD